MVSNRIGWIDGTMSRRMKALLELVKSKQITINNLLSEFKATYPDLEEDVQFSENAATLWLLKHLRGYVATNNDGLLLLNQSGKEQLESYKQNEIIDFRQEEIEKMVEEIKIQLDDGAITIHHLLAEYVMSLHIFRTLNDTKEVLIYNEDGGVYEFGGESVIASDCEKLLEQLDYKERCTNHLVEETIGHVIRSTEVKRENFDSDLNIINLKNGLFDLRTYELSQHTPMHLSLVQVPVEYNQQADCPKIKKFLEEIYSGSSSDIAVTQELAGYLLMRKYFIQKAVLFWGYGANGKSTLVKLLVIFVGLKNTSAQSLQDLLTDRFSKAELFGKLLNACPDIPSKALYDTGNFKALTGGDEISAQKKFKNPFHFYNYAKLVFTANVVPKTEDESDAFFRRWIILSFPNKFEGKSDNKNLINELTSTEELSGFLNFTIEGLKRLLEQGEFSYSKTTEDLRELYTKMSNPVETFVKEMTETNSDWRTGKDRLYQSFANYCRENKLAIQDKSLFGREIKKYAGNISESKPEIGGRRVHCWVGIKLKSSDRNPDVDITDENAKSNKTLTGFIKK